MLVTPAFHSKNYPFTLDILEVNINGKFTEEFEKKYEVSGKEWEVMLRYWIVKEKNSLRTIAHRLNRVYSTITYRVRKVGGDYFSDTAQKMTREILKCRGSNND